MDLRTRRIRILAVTIVASAGMLVLSACSNASAGPASSTDTAANAAAQSPTVTPTPSVVSNVPFPLDPAPTSASQGGSGTAPNQGSRRREGEREGREGDEGGAFGERGSIQRVAVTITNSGLQLSTTSAKAGAVEFDLTNQTSASHHILISGNGVNGDSGAIDPGATVHLQGTLPAGRYQLTIDSPSNSGSSVTLQLQ